MLQPGKQQGARFAVGMSVLLTFVLTSCAGAGRTVLSPLSVPPGRDGASQAAIEPTAAQSRVSDTALSGKVTFPEPRTTQAAPDYAAKNATLTLISLADNLTIVTGRANTDGTFVLSLNGFTPAPGSRYLLEASHGLNNNAAGNEMARFRTFLTWSGSAWTSISGSTIVLNAQTTAVAVISSLDPINVPASATMNKVSGTSLNASPALTNHSDTEISTLAGEMLNYLIQDFDPVRNTPSIRPSITALNPSNPTSGGAVILSGSGFSPIQTGNLVRFGSATASIFTASARTLGVFVPPGAPSSGIVTVKTSLGTSQENAAYTLTATGGSGGGGSGGTGGLGISELVPANGAPGDSIMIRGSGFSTVLTENVVKFAGVDAEVTYADTDALVAKVPAGAASGPMTVTVGGVTKGFYFNFTVPIVASFTPLSGNELTSVTVNGQNFATQGPQSKIRFNGVPSPNITSWFGTQAVGLAPPPSLTARISGPLTVQSDAGIISQSGGPFTARQFVIENFSTTNQRNAATTAAWGSSALQPAAAATTLSQAGAQLGTNTNTDVVLSGSNLTLKPTVLPHTGILSTYNYFTQLGVDASSYFISNGTGDSPTIYRYSLADGSLLGTAIRTGINGVIWDSANNQYLSHNYATTASTPLVRKFTPWNDTTYLGTSGGWNTPFIATNGSNYFLCNYPGSNPNITTTIFGSVYNYSLASAVGQSAAGIAGSNTFYFNANTSISSLTSYTTTGTTGTVTLPFTIGPPTGGTGYPSIGSDGQYIYILGTNASYNGGANALFKFAVSGSSLLLVNNPAGTSITSAISLPANSLWDAISVNKTVPGGTTLTVDVLDGSTNAVLMTNVANGASLNGITAASIKLRANLTGTSTSAPSLTSWSVTTRPSYAISNGYDTGTSYGQYEASTIAANNANYAIQYADSADNTTWGSWVSDITTLNRRYIRFKVNFSASNTQITRVTLPYTY